MNIRQDYDNLTEQQLLDTIDGLVTPMYNHLKRGAPYPPEGYDFSQPRVRYTGLEDYIPDAKKYAIERNWYLIFLPFDQNLFIK